MPATLLNLLLIIAGIEQNPGPDVWICSVCHNRILRNTTSVQCTVCKNWCHLKRCSGLATHRDWSPSFVASCCNPPHQIPRTNARIASMDHGRSPPHDRHSVSQSRCSVCQEVIRRNITSVQCNGCRNWCHMRRCTNLRSHRDWNSSFLAGCCLNNPPTATRNTPVVTVQSSPNDSSVYTPLRTPMTQHHTPRTNARIVASQNIGQSPPRDHHGASQWRCSICREVIRRNITSVQCNGCRNWCHMRRCTNLRFRRDWNSSFLADCCINNPPIVTRNTPVVTVQSSPNDSSVHTPRRTPPIQQHGITVTNLPRLPDVPLIPTPRHRWQQPVHTRNSHQTFKIMQLNCNGLRNKVVEITNYMHQHDILIAAIQETKLATDCTLSSSSNYNIIRRDRERDHGGGLAFIIRRNVAYRVTVPPTPPIPDPFLEVMSISICTGDIELEIVNVYIPPVNSIGASYHPSVGHLLQGDNRIILGDFNAHHESWYSQLPNDPRGILIADQIDDSDFAAINENFSTRVTARCSSSPDISIVCSSLLANTTWQAHVTLNSDHIPILVTVEKPCDFVEPDKRTFVNYDKANWHGFTNYVDESLRHLPPPTCARKGERIFREIILKAAKRYIPAGRIPNIRPNFPSNAARLARQRDIIRASNPADERIEQLTAEITVLTNEHRRSKWLDHLSHCTISSKKLWSTIRSLSGTNKNNNLAAIAFNNTQYTDARRCATLFCRQFVEHPVSQNRIKRAVVRRTKNLKRDSEPHTFTSVEVQNIISISKPSKALGPDGISMLMLKKLGTVGLGYLTQLLRLSIHDLVIPDIWKVARVIPILKPNKPATEGESYRPISLLSPVAKVLEALLLPTLKEHFPLADHQHGFREAHSTTTALNLIATQIANGLNQQRPCQRTVVAALDLSKAFDTVDHSMLISDILNSTLSNNIKRWIASYLNGRQAFVEFRGQKSSYRKIKMGVPQGGVLSPLLFNIYLAGLPAPPREVSLVSYADDCTILSSGVEVSDINARITQYLAAITDFFKERNLRLSTSKSTVSLFTSWTKEVRMELDISVEGRRIPTVQNPKILGVVFDSLLHFSSHAGYIAKKVKTRNKVLKALAGTSWGMTKETIIATYKAIGRSLLDYAAPVWTSFLSDTQWRSLQTAQNNALRIATGCVKMTSVDHLHEETRLLSVRQHNVLLTRQFLLACHQPSHPNRHILMQDPPPRHIRKDIRSYCADIQGVIPSDADRLSMAAARKTLHQTAVLDAINGYRCNRVLDEHPPAISDSERQLPRYTRTILAQLRAGWCSLLNCYRERIIPGTLNRCPTCLQSPHDTVHLFHCSSRPTDLRPIDLWLRPTDVAHLLQLPLPPGGTVN